MVLIKFCENIANYRGSFMQKYIFCFDSVHFYDDI